MSKKRVYELAKDLGLSNKEMVDWLKSHDYDVKSHSSSLEDDQARAVLEKFASEKAPKAAPPKPSTGGVVLRRKKADVLVPEGQQEQVHAGAEAHGNQQGYSPAVHGHVDNGQAQAHAPHTNGAEAAAQAAAEAQQVEPQQAAPEIAPAEAQQPQAAAEPVEAAPQQAEQPAQPQQQVEAAQPAAAAVAQQPAAAAAAVVLTSPPPARPSTLPSQPVAHAPRTAEPQKMPPAQPSGPHLGRAPLVSRPGTTTPPGRGPLARPAASAPTGPIVRGPGGTQSVQVTERGTARPTATQAVVLSRPLIPIARPPPRPTPGGGPPRPGGFRPRPIGEVRELQVVGHGPGRGREFIDVTKDKAKQVKKGPRVEKVESLSKQDLVELAKQRYSVPIRGHKKKSAKKGKGTEITEMSEHKKVIRIEETITLSELSQRMGVKSSDLIRKLMAGGKMVTQNQPIDFDTASLLALDHGWKTEKVGFEVDEFLPEQEDRPEDYVTRPPIVTIMGHVDHGKTSLLDAIRKANVAEGEAGGITQHIGAYSVDVIGSNGVEANITFLDTPGHEAFTAMRARGANVTDVAVLVVAADDGVMPQTIESINHAKAAKVTIVVALNKIDKEGAQPQRIKQQLSEHGLVAEDWGGDTMMVPVSARTGEGIEKLLEAILLQAEVMELKANPTKLAKGVVIEAKLEKGRGPVATVLVQEGTLRVGDPIVTGVMSGHVRALLNEHGMQVDDVPPGFPVEVLGLDGVPSAGDDMHVVEDEESAVLIAEHRREKQRDKDLSKSSKVSLEDLLQKTKVSTQKELRVIVKADVGGSVEALKVAIEKLSTPKVKVEILHAQVGNVNEGDVMLAAASKALLIGFNVKPEAKANEAASQQQVTLKNYTIIYEALDDIKLAMEAQLDAIIREKAVGKAKVQALFNVPKLGTIAGSSVTDGKITRASMVRLMRDSKPIFTGKIASLRRFKDDVKEVDKGFECGIGIEGFNELREGDVIEAYELETIRPSLS